jgi:uncharacterized OsmC-like protein
LGFLEDLVQLLACLAGCLGAKVVAQLRVHQLHKVLEKADTDFEADDNHQKVIRSVWYHTHTQVASNETQNSAALSLISFT